MIADYGVFAAMAIVYMLPVFVFFVISQKQLMEGNIGGGKGV
jgi:inositol-phosphate transport system permease protein